MRTREEYNAYMREYMNMRRAKERRGRLCEDCGIREVEYRCRFCSECAQIRYEHQSALSDHRRAMKRRTA